MAAQPASEKGNRMSARKTESGILYTWSVWVPATTRELGTIVSAGMFAGSITDAIDKCIVDVDEDVPGAHFHGFTEKYVHARKPPAPGSPEPQAQDAAGEVAAAIPGASPAAGDGMPAFLDRSAK